MSGAAQTAGGGFPGPLPAGERVLWQGAPDRQAFAARALHLRTVMIYFACLAAISAAMSWSEARPLGEALAALARVGLATAAVYGLIQLYAALAARTTRYAITDRRILMRIGVALPVTFNLPYAGIEAAGLKTYEDRSGDIPLTLGGTGRIAYLHLWPHARPWRLGRAEPMLRAVPDAAVVAATLARAYCAARPLARPATVRQDEPAGLAHGALPPVAA